MSQNNKPASSETEKNMSIYNQLREVPAEAKKPIKDGRLKGKTDVNPMWRIKRMTEIFGPCGIGWKYAITRQWLEKSNEDAIAAFCNVDLFVKDPETGTWSEAIPGTGGNVFKRKEGSGSIYTDDDCFKKALTDALSIAMKALGVAADVFYEQDQSKYAESFSQGSATAPASSGIHTRPATDPVQAAAKPVLNPQSKFWNNSITTAMSTADPAERIRARIEAKFTISDADFAALMSAAGKPLTRPAVQPAAMDSDDLPF